MTMRGAEPFSERMSVIESCVIQRGAAEEKTPGANGTAAATVLANAIGASITGAGTRAFKRANTGR